MKKRITAFILAIAIISSILTSCSGHVHSYDEKTIIEEASCESAGSMKLSCSCGDYITKSIPKAHRWSESRCGETQTCTVSGCEQTRTNPNVHSLDYSTKSCKNCSRPAIIINLPEGTAETDGATPVTLYNGSTTVTVLWVSVTSCKATADAVTITWSAVKVQNRQDLSDALTPTVISYKIIDAEGYVIKSGSDSAPSIAVGDKVRNLSFTINGLKIWETYTLEFADVYN